MPKLIANLPGIMITISLAILPGLDALAGTTHDYKVSVDYALKTLWVEARFSTPVDSVTARSRDAGKYLVDVRGCDKATQIKIRNRRMMLPENGIGCMKYTVDLARASKVNRQNRVLSDGNFIVSSSLWLWRPEVNKSTDIRLQFRLPENVRVSVPWQKVDDSAQIYRLAHSPESSNAPIAFGDFEYQELSVPGATLRVSLLNGIEPMDNAAILNWVSATATDVSLAYGRFPNPSPQIIVIPVGDSMRRGDDGEPASAVPFGRVTRDGGETVELFVDQSQPIESFLTDWTATHEFSHLMLPYLDSGHRWISEGFAQYYQNILLARSGTYDEQKAWQKIYEGLERGRQSRPELSPNAASSGRDRAGLMKVYWSGAALALMADVELRERSNGSDSLDQVLARLRSCCLPSTTVWSGTKLFKKLDSLTATPVFMRLYRRYADTAGFPDTLPVLQRLGLAVSDGEVHFRRNGELAEIRVAITETDSATASWRNRLAYGSPP